MRGGAGTEEPKLPDSGPDGLFTAATGRPPSLPSLSLPLPLTHTITPKQTPLHYHPPRKKTPNDSELVSSMSRGWNCSFCPRDRQPYFMTGRAHPSLLYFYKAAFLSRTDKPPSPVSQVPVHVGGVGLFVFLVIFFHIKSAEKVHSKEDLQF